MYEYFDYNTKINLSFLVGIKKAAGAAFSTGLRGLFFPEFFFSSYKLFP